MDKNWQIDPASIQRWKLNAYRVFLLIRKKYIRLNSTNRQLKAAKRQQDPTEHKAAEWKQQLPILNKDKGPQTPSGAKHPKRFHRYTHKRNSPYKHA